MTVQQLNVKQSTGSPVTVLKERAGRLTGLLFTFFLCTLLLLSMVLNTLSHLEERIANIEEKVSDLSSVGVPKSHPGLAP